MISVSFQFELWSSFHNTNCFFAFAFGGNYQYLTMLGKSWKWRKCCRKWCPQMKIAGSGCMCYVCMVEGLEGLAWHWMTCLSRPSRISLTQMDKEGDCVDPIAQPSFGHGNSEEAGKAIPDACETCLIWSMLSEALPSLFPQGLSWAWWDCPLVRRARETEGCSWGPTPTAWKGDEHE